MKKTLILLPLILMLGCTSTNSFIEEGDFVTIDFTGYLENGTIFETSVGGEPLTFNSGAGELIPGFDQAVMGMNIGEDKTFTLTPEQAYGQVNSELIIDYNKTVIIEGIGAEPELGMLLQTSNGYLGKVVMVNDTIVTLDFNSPLAGKTLTFTVTILDIIKK